ncbi:LacI family DNA-binding transcriptional regulator [Erythrobacter sp.]|uniref:LacI family DNA-binding transcriptional regulator n=1 Tax=Erythrobacter sp. TaxID=1042 RepID=UPI0025D7440D|nr:LacI family DNA-binding transcriptional regulator [Erythrobacter sp.]
MQEAAARGITIEDVAKAAAVSRQTVSRVINYSPRVSAEAKARVEQAIARLGYVPSLAARSMAGGGSRLLLAVFAAPAPGESPALPLDRLLLSGTSACSARGYRLLFEPIAPNASPAQAAAQLAATLGAVQPDGVILLPPLGKVADLREVLEKPRRIACETLRDNDDTRKNPGESAAQRLLALGHRQVGYITGPGDPERSRHWLAGYRRALAQNGSRAHRYFVADDQPDIPAVLDCAHSWLMPTIRPTAIITERADAALAVLHVAGALKLRIPRDLSLISLEDDPALTRSQPAIAALHDPAADRFAAACERLIAARTAAGGDAIGAEAPSAPTPDLIERASLTRAPRTI